MDKLCEKIIKFRWIIIAFWILLGGIVFLKAPLLSEVAKGDQASFLPADSEVSKAADLFKKLYPNSGKGSSLVLVFHRNGILKDIDREYARNLELFLNKEKETYRIREIQSPFSVGKLEDTMISKNKNAAMMIVNLNVPSFKDITNDVVKTIRRTVQPGIYVKGAPVLPEGLVINVTGDAALGQETNDNVKDSMNRTTIITIFLVIVVLVFIYRSPIAPLIPLFTIALSFIISRGIVAEFTYFGLKVSSFTETFMMAVLFGAGTDYCLLLTSRFREEIVSGKVPGQALKATLPKTLIAIVSSGSTVIVGFFAMVLAKFGLYNTTGPSIAIGVGITILAVVTLTPSAIAILGEFIFWPVRPSKRIEKEKEGNRFWNKLSMNVTQKPVRFILISLLVFIPFVVTTVGIKRSFDELSELPSKSDALIGFNVIKANFNQGEMLPVKVVLNGNRDMWSNESLQVVDDIAKSILKVDGVAKVRTATRPNGDPITEVGLPKQISALSQGVGDINNGSKQIADGISKGSQDMNKLVAGTQELMNGISDMHSKLNESNGQVQNIVKSTKDFGKKIDEFSQGLIKSKAADDNAAMLLVNVVKLFDFLKKTNTALASDPGFLNAYQALQGAIAYINGASTAMGKMADELTVVKPMIATANEGITGSKEEMKRLDDALIKVNSGLEQIKTGQSKAATGMQAAAENLAKITSGLSSVQNTAGEYATKDSNLNNVFYLPDGILEKYPALKDAMSYYISPNGNGVSFDVILSVSPYSKEALDGAQEIKKAVAFAVKGTVLGNVEFHISGSTSAFSELRDITSQDFAKIIFFVLLGIFIVLVILLRSLTAPVYLILTIILSYASTMGISYIVFQVILGQTGLSWSVPFFSFCILVALGVDYNIFLMTRVKEEYTPGDVTGGVQRALASTGKIITSCGIIMAGTFGALIASPVTQLVEIGFTAVVGLLLDTFIIRCLMVPAIAVKIGELNWWPGRKVKVLPYKD